MAKEKPPRWDMRNGCRRHHHQRYTGGHGNPDISAEGLDAYHIEAKRVERLNIGEAMKQAEDDAAGKIPVVMHRRSRQPWLITMHLKDWIQREKTGEDGR